MSETKKLFENMQNNLNENDERPSSIDDVLAKLSEYMDNAGLSTQEVLKEISKYVNDSIFYSLLEEYEKYLKNGEV